MFGGPRTWERTAWWLLLCDAPGCPGGVARPPAPKTAAVAHCPRCGTRCRVLPGSGPPQTRGRFLGDRPALLFSTPAPQQTGATAFDHYADARRTAGSKERARRERNNRLAHEIALSARHECIRGRAA